MTVESRNMKTGKLIHSYWVRDMAEALPLIAKIEAAGLLVRIP